MNAAEAGKTVERLRKFYRKRPGKVLMAKPAGSEPMTIAVDVQDGCLGVVTTGAVAWYEAESEKSDSV